MPPAARVCSFRIYDYLTWQMAALFTITFALAADIGLLLGLLAVAACTSCSAAGDQGTRESAGLATLDRGLGGLRELVQAQLQARLCTCTRELIHVSCPARQNGIVPVTASAILGDFNDSLHAFKPADLGEAALHGEAISQADNFVELLTLRLANVVQAFPLYCAGRCRSARS